jgi:hemerythrin
MAIPWTPALAIGVPEIDHQHQELFLRIEQLVQGVSRGNATDVECLLEFLGQYVVKHFGAEERWMLRSAYPDYARHKAEHERFIRDYEHMRQEFREKGPNVLVGIRMNNWIASSRLRWRAATSSAHEPPGRLAVANVSSRSRAQPSTLNPIRTVTWNSETSPPLMAPRISATSNQLMFRRVFPAPETADLTASATLFGEVPTTSIFLKVAKVEFLSS